MGLFWKSQKKSFRGRKRPTTQLTVLWFYSWVLQCNCYNQWNRSNDISQNTWFQVPRKRYYYYYFSRKNKSGVQVHKLFWRTKRDHKLQTKHSLRTSSASLIWLCLAIIAQGKHPHMKLLQDRADSWTCFQPPSNDASFLPSPGLTGSSSKAHKLRTVPQTTATLM